MDALVVVESVFGNTREVAEAIAAGMAGRMTVRVVDAADAPAAVSGLDLLVVGGPTHAFGMSWSATRRTAAEQSGGAVEPAAVGIREWLAMLVAGAGAAATFDTGMSRLRIFGSAANGAARLLKRRGYRMLTRPMTFRVAGTQGPLIGGERERAVAWGACLAQQLVGSGVSEVRPDGS
jgi:hypothetical protein